MPTLEVTIHVNGNPLAFAYVEHLVLGVGQDKMYMTDLQGRVRSQDGDLGINSFTNNADIRILCQNPVVKILDGNTPGLPLAVNQDRSVVDGSIINLNTSAEQRDHYRILNRCLLAYGVVFRQFRPFSDASRRNFPLGRKSSLRASKDQTKRIEITFPSQFPLGDLAFTEPKSIATSYPLMHIRSRASATDSLERKAERGRLFGEDGAPPTLLPSELAHALHFSLFSSNKRQQIQNDYIGWITSDLANGGDGGHSMGRPTNPMVAYIEALDHFSSRFAEFIRQTVPGGGTLQHPPITDQIRQDFLAREISGTPIAGLDVAATLNAGGNIVPNPRFNGSDDEGSVYGCIFLDFARRVDMQTAVSAYLRSATSGVITFGGYKTWIQNNLPQHLPALETAQATWGL